jgi:hypothetical protein
MPKAKCPKCGAKNSKERMVCIECGTALASEHVERHLPQVSVEQVSTEAEVQVKSVIEKEPKEVVDDEYHDNEKVLFKTRGSLRTSFWKSEEANCFVTESHVMIETQESIRIAVSHITDCQTPAMTKAAALLHQDMSCTDVTATLIFRDDSNRKHKLDLDMSVIHMFNFKHAVLKQVLKHAIEEPSLVVSDRVLKPILETFRDKTRDNVCVGLQELGLNTVIAERGRIEEKVFGDGSLGITRIFDGPIRWVNTRRKRIYRELFGKYGVPTEYYTDYGVPDSRLGIDSPSAGIRAIHLYAGPLSDKVVDIHWDGGESYPDIIDRLNSNTEIKETIMRNVDIDIMAFPVGCWLISTKWSDDYRIIPTKELWNCYQAIANHLLAEWKSK